MRGKSTLSPSSQTSIWAEGCLIETPSVRVPLTVSSRWLNHCWSACVGCPSVEPRMESSSPFFAVQMRSGERVLGCSENLMKRPLYLSPHHARAVQQRVGRRVDALHLEHARRVAV